MSFIPGPLRLRRENQRFFINTNEVRGAQSLQFSYAVPSVPLRHIGQTGVHHVVDGPYAGNVSLSSFIFTGDPIIKHTGDSPFNGYLYETKEGKSLDADSIDIAFTSGFLNSYSINCGIGQIPRIDAEIGVVGNIGKLPSSEATSSLVSSDYSSIQSNENKDFDLKIADPRSLKISMNDFESNRLNSFSIAINIGRNPIYALGEKTPVEVKRNFPIEVLCSFQIDLDAHNMGSKAGYEQKVLRDFPCSETAEDLTLTFYDHYTESEVVSYSFSDLLLVSQSHGANIDGNVVATLGYRALINKNKV